MRYLLAGLVVLLWMLGMTAPWSPSGWMILIALTTLALGPMIRAPWRSRLLRGGATLLAVLIVARACATEHPRVHVRMLPEDHSSRWWERIVDEQDLALLASRAVVARWPLRGDEKARFVPALRETYAELRAVGGPTASPVIASVLGRESPDDFDVIEIAPDGKPTRTAVVFLHGYAGGAVLECWLVAKAALQIDALTVCPSTSFKGRWSDRDGALTLRRTIDALHARGIERIFLAGLSNGGVGAGTLAPRFSESLAGLILISGAPSSGDAGGLPTLVVQGDRDPMASAGAARSFATRSGGSYVGLDGGHFVLLTRPAAVTSIARWLAARRP